MSVFTALSAEYTGVHFLLHSSRYAQELSCLNSMKWALVHMAVSKFAQDCQKPNHILQRLRGWPFPVIAPLRVEHRPSSSFAFDYVGVRRYVQFIIKTTIICPSLAACESRQQIPQL